MKPPTAVVLAGGVGKRFWPITTSKPLLPFMGKPLVAYTLETLRRAGISDILVVTNEDNDSYIRTLSLTGGRLRTVVQHGAGGMGDALLTAAQAVRLSRILVVNAADVIAQDLVSAVLKAGGRPGIEAVIPGVERKEYFAGGYLKLEGKRLIEIVEKPKAGRQPSHLINVVVHYFRDAKPLLDQLQQGRKGSNDHYERAVTRFLKDHLGVTVPYRGMFGVVKYPWDILSMMRLFLTKFLTNTVSTECEIHPTALIEGPVMLQRGVRVAEHAVIKGPSFIGEGSRIGTNSLVIESMIAGRCVVGFASEVTRSYIGQGCWLHTNYIGDSVLEGGNYFGAGAVTANFRFDEGEIMSQIQGTRRGTGRTKLGCIAGRDARVGVNASLMPGVKLGSGSRVGPGFVLVADVPDNSTIFADPQYLRNRPTVVRKR